MLKLKTAHERIPFSSIQGLPVVDVTFTASRISPDCNFIDILDFKSKVIDRWTLPLVQVPSATDLLKKVLPEDKLPPGINGHDKYCDDHLMRPHIAHFSKEGKLFINVSDNYNGFCVFIVDTVSGEACVFPEGFESDLKCYTSTGSFSHDNKYWMFLRWPLADALQIKNGTGNGARCEIGRLHTGTLESEVIYSFDGGDENHHISCSPDGRYAVFAPFKWDLRVPYPPCAFSDDAEGYRKSHEGGIIPHAITTVDLKTKEKWACEIPVPVLGHFEFDPDNPSIFYASAHNICPAPGGLMLEGPAALFKLRIEQGKTEIIGEYSDSSFFRIRQHSVFQYQGRTVIAVTNFPNFLDLIDGEKMTLWRRISLFDAPPVDLSSTGSAICPVYRESCFFVNPSSDGRHIVLGNSECFSIYDVDNDMVLEVKVPLYISDECSDVGHTRSIGV